MKKTYFTQVSAYILCRALVILSFFFLLTDVAFSQVNWIHELKPNSGYWYCGFNLPTLRGDIVVVNASVTNEPKCPSPASLHIWTRDGGVRETLTPNQPRREFEFRASGQTSICSQIEKWDRYHSGYVKIGIRQRINLSPILRRESDGTISYGYINSPVEFGADRWIKLRWYYARGQSIMGAGFGEETVTVQNGYRSEKILMPSTLPNPPQGATHLLLRLDDNFELPETNESDNTASLPLSEIYPNIRVIDLVYLPEGRIQFGYKVTGTTNFWRNKKVKIELFYAKGTDPTKDILYDHPRIAFREIVLQTGKEEVFDISPGHYILPDEKTTHLIAVVDGGNEIPETIESDNSLIIKSEMPDDYRIIYQRKGLSVLRKDIDRQPAYYMIVADLEKSDIRSNRDTSQCWPSPEDHWEQLEKKNSRSVALGALINGTFFGPAETVAACIPGMNVSLSNLRYSYGLRQGAFKDTGFDLAGKDYINFFTWGDDSAAIIPYKQGRDTQLDPYGLFSKDEYKNLVSLLPTQPWHPIVHVNSEESRNWIAIRDWAKYGSIGEKRFRTVLVLISTGKDNGFGSLHEMELFGPEPGSIGQLDAKTSTTLMADGETLFRARNHGITRGIIHTLGFYYRK